jgi:uncharacterized protein
MPLLMCPNCQASMQSVTRSGVEFDMCPTCRGVWLDRGELEKLVSIGGNGAPSYAEPDMRDPRPDHTGRNRWSGDDDDDERRPRRRGGFSLLDIFD